MRALSLTLGLAVIVLLLIPMGTAPATAEEPATKARLDRIEALLVTLDKRVGELEKQDKARAGRLKELHSEVSTVRSWIAAAREQFAVLSGVAAGEEPDAPPEIRITHGLVYEKVLLEIKGEEFIKFVITGRIKGLTVAGRIGLTIHLQDVHGRTYLSIDHTTETVYPGNALRYEGLIKLSDFGNEDVWARTTEGRDMRVAFDIEKFTSVKDLPRSARSAR